MRGLIFCDIDKTIQDQSGNVNDDSIFEVIRRMQADGWMAGVNSDTSIKRILDVVKKFGFNGPIVSERGTIVHDERHEPIIVNRMLVEEFVFIKTVLPAFLKDKLGRKALINIIRNFTEDSSTARELKSEFFPQVLCYFTRQASMSFSVLNDYQGRDPVEDEFFLRFVEVLWDFIHLAKLDNLTVEYYSGDTIVQLVDKYARKGSPVDALMELYGIDRIFMLGDSKYDNLIDHRVVQCAVGNASDTYKAVCKYIAEAEYSAGAVEILRWIDDNF